MYRERVVEFAALALMAVAIAIISYAQNFCFRRICSAVCEERPMDMMLGWALGVMLGWALVVLIVSYAVVYRVRAQPANNRPAEPHRRRPF